jgi:hypothetical protein
VPSSRSRKPIDYQTRSADALFRNQTKVDAELAAVEEPETGAGDRPSEPTSIPTTGQPIERTIDAPSGRTNERTVEPLAVLAAELPKTRHSFDLPKQQLDALYDIQDQRRRLTGKKPTMGALLEEALTDYIRKQQRAGRG